jgi:hypothetical protein
MKDSREEMINLARKAKIYHDEYDAGRERTLKTMDKARRYDQLYHDGYSLGAAGGSIDGETELVEENGKMIPKKEHRNFKAGYKKGLEIFKLRIGVAKNNVQNDIHRSR